MEVTKQLDMAISRSKYISLCEATSDVLIDHVIKLLYFDSPENIRNWEESVAKGLKVETYETKLMKVKPTIEHLAKITNRDNVILDDVLQSRINSVTLDSKYSSLKVRDNVSPNSVKIALIELIFKVDESNKMTESQIKLMIDDWYSDQLYKVN